MNYLEILNHIVKHQIIGILRVNNADIALKATKAMYNGGIRSIEATMNVPNILSVIQDLSDEYVGEELLIGAGTVLDEASCRLAILSGANFIVTPNIDEGVIKCANRYQKPMVCGTFTVTEIVKAMELGVNIVKVFPSSVGSYDYLKAIDGPLPQAMIAPTGGINRENLLNWRDSGAVAYGISGEFSKLANAEKYEELEKVSKEYVDILKGIN